MKLLFNNSIYDIETIGDALNIIDEYCIEYDMKYDGYHDDNGDKVIDLFEIYVDDEGVPHKTYQLQAVIRDE